MNIEESPVLRVPLQTLAEKFISPLTPDAIADDNELLFTLENAYWFNLGVNRENSLPEYAVSIKKGLKSLSVSLCNFTPVLSPKANTIKDKINGYMESRCSIPIVALALLDKTMNYVLLVQSHFGPPENWTFPKGEKLPKQSQSNCVSKYADLFLGYNVKKKLDPNTVIEKNIQGHSIKLMIVKDGSMNISLKPKISQAIKKIQWFSVWDLPQGAQSIQTPEDSTRHGVKISDFLTVAPFVAELQEFIHNHRKNDRPSQGSTDVNIGKRNSSAFIPVVPKKSSGNNQNQNQSVSSNSGAQAQTLSPLSVSTNPASSEDSMFKPLSLTSQCSPITQQSFTGISFLQMVTSMKSPTAGTSSHPDPVPTPEIKHPKPIHPSKVVALAYEDPEICPSMSRDFFSQVSPEAEHLEDDSAALDQTAELCLSTLESVLQTPAVERKPFPGEPSSSLFRGSIPMDSVSPSEPGESCFFRTPKSSRGKRPRKKTRKSQNGDRESVSPTNQTILEESFHGQHAHEQGIDIDVSNVIRNVSPRPKSMSTPSPPSIRQGPEHPIIHAPVATTRSYLPFSPPATAPTPGTLPVFSETSAFTPVKASPSSSTKTNRSGNGFGSNVPLTSPIWGSSLNSAMSTKNGKSNGSENHNTHRSQEIPAPRLNFQFEFKMDMKKIISAYQGSVERLKNV
ncbi:hypothetical protein FO519_003583 [Halicephalobus sp. NKZ332]|nr:hypothetical protein FO519_003583 [Halicephalobus sp. NKZ332]